MAIREVIFRGKRKDNGEWFYGYLVHQTEYYGDSCDNYHIIAEGEFDYDEYRSEEVIPETVGQYTGLHDNTKWEELTKEEQLDWLKNHTVDEWNGKKIFEGDIVKEKDVIHNGEIQIKGEIFKVEMHAGCYIAKNETCFNFLNRVVLNLMGGAEIIGNIHDNSELLKGGVENE